MKIVPAKVIVIEPGNLNVVFPLYKCRKLEIIPSYFDE